MKTQAGNRAKKVDQAISATPRVLELFCRPGGFQADLVDMPGKRGRRKKAEHEGTAEPDRAEEHNRAEEQQLTGTGALPQVHGRDFITLDF